MTGKYSFHISNIKKVRINTVLFIAIFWTVIDLTAVLIHSNSGMQNSSIGFREMLIFMMSLAMGYLFVYRLKRMFHHYPLWINFLAKSVILLFSAFLIVFIIQFLHAIVFLHKTSAGAYSSILSYALHKNWLLQQIIYWMSIFFVTQLILMINEKYSPGVFIDILTGRYIHPKIENRIVMFMDLKDSTPIAESLGHSLYFLFIRDFIYRVSLAILESEGTIYQYVGDEVVCSWKTSKRNSRKCLDAVIQSRKNIKRNSAQFEKKYGIVPEFRVGIHVGEVTVGEIGVVKRDLAMSGDTMNTTARIRSACNELRHHFIVSKDFIDISGLEYPQSASLGMVDLKGKDRSIELFHLKI